MPTPRRFGPVVAALKGLNLGACTLPVWAQRLLTGADADTLVEHLTSDCRLARNLPYDQRFASQRPDVLV